MSIPVEVGDLARRWTTSAPATCSPRPAARVKVVTVEPTVTDGVVLVEGPGKGTVANLADNAAVTLVFPPREPRGFTLLVDGTAEVTGDDVRITPATAVLHRPASHADGPPAPDGCGHDCAPLPSTA